MSILLTTTTQLLASLRSGENEPAWSLLVARYEPVLVGVARRMGLGEADAADAAQQTLVDMVREVRGGGFDRQRGGLRRWALGILRHRVVDIVRARPAAIDVRERRIIDVDLEESWEAEFERHLAVTALESLRTSTRFNPNTLLAFELTVIREVPPQAVAIECGMSTDEVYVARSRVARKLRDTMADLRKACLDAEQ
ncbi:MAG: sigma-70 family RNA polymerase sigma factor [Phycisphaerae bacterium]|nr:sigma-70 family RNA polymerase sigma factor [Phycisphaerae bacterium]